MNIPQFVYPLPYYYQYYLIIGINFIYDYTINFNYLTHGSLKLAC